MTTRQQARVALDKALANDGELIIRTESRRAAHAFRFLLYKERMAFRKALAKAEGRDPADTKTEYDDLEIRVEADAGGGIVKIGMNTGEIVFVDPKTGDKI